MYYNYIENYKLNIFFNNNNKNFFLRGDNMNGLEELMKDLNVSSFEELKAYIEAPEHQDEEIVKQLKEALEIYLEK